jgi:UDP-GlcNAc:undecaprenyl-phosphate GlcNAc-1-phosphate transferase
VIASYLVILGISAAATFALGFPARWFAVRIGAVVHPDARRVHPRPTPTTGGSAMFLAFLLAMVVASRLGAFGPVFHQTSEPLGVVIGAAAIFFVGLVDDIRDMSAPAKVAGQVFAAMLFYFLGVTMYTLKIPFVAGLVVLSPSILPLVTALWVIGMANAVNLIDGLDGLAAGIVALAAGAQAIFALRLENLNYLPNGSIGPLVAVIACGVCIGFLPHNFHPARIFMGDSGAMFLGALMACSTMVVGGRMPDTSGASYFLFAPLFIPLFILGVPILDTLFAIIRRTVRRVSIAHPDRGHLHHQLMKLGHGQRRAVLILWAWTALMSAFALYPSFYPHTLGRTVIVFGGAVLAVLLYTLFRPGFLRIPSYRRAEAAVADDSGAAGVALAGAAAGAGPGAAAGVEAGGPAMAAADATGKAAAAIAGADPVRTGPTLTLESRSAAISAPVLMQSSTEPASSTAAALAESVSKIRSATPPNTKGSASRSPVTEPLPASVPETQSPRT